MKSFAIATLFAVSAAAAASSNGTSTVAVGAASSTRSATQCYAQFYSCGSAPNTNHAFCASQYAACLGHNPFGANGALTTTGRPAAAAASSGVATAGAVGVNGNATVTQSPVAYTGAAAAQIVAGSGLFAALAGAVALL